MVELDRRRTLRLPFTFTFTFGAGHGSAKVIASPRLGVIVSIEEKRLVRLAAEGECSSERGLGIYRMTQP